MRKLGRVLAVAAIALVSLDVAGGFPAGADPDRRSDQTQTTEDNDTNDGGTPNNVPDEGDNRHPSGRDRSVENGRSGNQGRSPSDPDGDENGGPDKPGGSGGVDKADQDGNNGCGNDDDFEDDNNGCQRRRRTTSTTSTSTSTTTSTTTSSTTTTVAGGGGTTSSSSTTTTTVGGSSTTTTTTGGSGTTSSDSSSDRGSERRSGAVVEERVTPPSAGAATPARAVESRRAPRPSARTHARGGSVARAAAVAAPAALGLPVTTPTASPQAALAFTDDVETRVLGQRFGRDEDGPSFAFTGGDIAVLVLAGAAALVVGVALARRRSGTVASGPAG